MRLLRREVYARKTAWLLTDVTASYVVPFWSWWRPIARRIVLPSAAAAAPAAAVRPLD